MPVAPPSPRFGPRQLVTWFPAIILPSATGLQCWTALTQASVEGISVFTWSLFFLANLGAIWLGTPTSPIEQLKKHLAFTLTALLDLAIIGVVLWRG